MRMGGIAPHPPKRSAGGALNMVGRIYSIFDRVAEEFGPPVMAKNDAVAVRMALGALKDARLDDFRLYQVGEFDDVKGFLSGLPEHVREISLVALREE